MLTTLLLAIAPVRQDWTPPPPPPVVPSPLLAQPRFAPFVVPESLRVVTSEPELQDLAPVVAELLEVLFERTVEVGPPPGKAGDVVLTLGYLADQVAGDPEALSVEVFADHVALSGTTPAGVARAAARLFQLFERDDESGAWSLPPVRIDDAPVYPWRAFELSDAGSAAAARGAVQLAFLSSFNTVVLRGTAQDTPWLADVERFARPRGIRVVLEGAAASYVRSSVDGDASLPVLWVGDPGVKEVPAALAGRRLIDGASVALQLVAGTSNADSRARAFAYRPLGAVEAKGTDGEPLLRPLIIGAQVVLSSAGTSPAARVPELLPYLVERLWGSHQTPRTPAEFEPRAALFVHRTRALLAARVAGKK